MWLEKTAGSISVGPIYIGYFREYVPIKARNSCSRATAHAKVGVALIAVPEWQAPDE